MEEKPKEIEAEPQVQEQKEINKTDIPSDNKPEEIKEFIKEEKVEEKPKEVLIPGDKKDIANKSNEKSSKEKHTKNNNKSILYKFKIKFIIRGRF